jgi:hypothetical protein
MHEVCSSGKLTLSQTAMSFFHAHRVANSNNPADYARGSWRVDGTNANSGFGNTARIIIRCPHDHTEQSPRGITITRMLAGHDEGRPWNGNWPHMDWPGIKLFRNFTNDLWAAGYLSIAGFNPLWQFNQRGVGNMHGEIPAGMRPLPQFRPDEVRCTMSRSLTINENPCERFWGLTLCRCC